MKNSIEQIIKNLSIFFLLIILAVGITTLLVLEQNNLYVKNKNLNGQKDVIHSLANLNNDDVEFTFIQINGKSTKLTYEIEKLQKLDKYDYTGKYLFDNSKEFNVDLNKLTVLTTAYNSAVRNYYTKKTPKKLNELDRKKLKEKNKKEFSNAYHNIINLIDKMILRNFSYIEDKFHLLEKASVAVFLLALFGGLWYRRRIKLINNDIRYLYSVGRTNTEYKIFSVEADAIKLRMGRKQVVSENPDMVDNVTQINNAKGMMASYGNKKSLKENHVTSVTVLEIDNFSKQNRAFSQEFTQDILKKIAFSISLHEQASDVMARTDFNQFTVIITRISKEQAYKDVDVIRQTITELKLNAPDGAPITITVTGGFMVKENNKSLDDAIRQAKELLTRTKANTKNSIGQSKDFAR